MNAWESVPFHAFNRQSRVTINVQRDLEEMLNKLDRPQGGLETKRLLQNRRKRKFLESAIPVGIVALLCLAFCLVHMVQTGSSIVNNREVYSYYNTLEELEDCANSLVKELASRKDYIESDGELEDTLNDAYDLTDIALHKIAPGDTKEEWRIADKLHEYRHNVMKDLNVMTDGMFYADFIQEVLDFGLATVKRIDQLPMWKRNRDYIKLTKQLYSIKTTVLVVNYTCSSPTTNSYKHSTLDMVTFLEHTEQNLNKIKLNDSSETSKFLRSSQKFFGNWSINSSSVRANGVTLFGSGESTCNKTVQNLSELLTYKLRRREAILQRLIRLNSSSLKGSILIFCSILLSSFLTVICVVMFGYLLRYECLVSVGVSDWYENVKQEVKEHDIYREHVLRRVCPQVLRDLFDPNAWSTMIPYYIPEATMAMLSIFNFNSFFQQFTSGQTVQILSFIMDLLDERMAQYNVFPITKFGDEQIVVSDTVNRRDGQHACVIANMALDIVSCCNDIEVGSGGGSKLQLKIGIHSGPCVGMLYIRKGKICFRLTGNSLRVLRKLHRVSTPNRIQVTDNTHRLLSKSEIYSLNCRGQIEVKGVSQHTIYWLNGRKVSVSAFQDCESHCSRVGSWLELEKKPLYRLDEDEGGYMPIDKGYRHRAFSIVSSSLDSYRRAGSQGPSSENE